MLPFLGLGLLLHILASEYFFKQFRLDTGTWRAHRQPLEKWRRPWGRVESTGCQTPARIILLYMAYKCLKRPRVIQSFSQSEVWKFWQAKPFFVGKSFQAVKAAGLPWSRAGRNLWSSWLMRLLQDSLRLFDPACNLLWPEISTLPIYLCQVKI